jgi:hypothetical protein
VTEVWRWRAEVDGDNVMAGVMTGVMAGKQLVEIRFLLLNA